MTTTTTEVLPCGFYPLEDCHCKDGDAVANLVSDCDALDFAEQIAVEILMDIRYDKNCDDGILNDLIKENNAKRAARTAAQEITMNEGNAYFAIKKVREGAYSLFGRVYFRLVVDMAD